MANETYVAVLFVTLASLWFIGRVLASSIALPSGFMLLPVDRRKGLQLPVTASVDGTRTTQQVVIPNGRAGIVAWVSSPPLRTTPWTSLIIVSFGNLMSLDSAGDDLLARVCEANPDACVVLWDYEGVGRSAGGGNAASAVARVAALGSGAVEVAEWALGFRDEYADREKALEAPPIVLWGHSLGSFAASRMAQRLQRDAAHLVLSSAFASIGDKVSLAPFLMPDLSPKQNLRSCSVSTRLTIVQAVDDEIFGSHQKHVQKLIGAYGPWRKVDIGSVTSRNAETIEEIDMLARSCGVRVVWTRGGHNSPFVITLVGKELARPLSAR